jgi:type II restriction enzyme
MKKQTKLTILIFLLSILIYDGALGQTNEYKSVNTGKFEVVTPTYGKTIITRTKTNQTEVNDSLKYQATFDLIWTDNCTYELRNKLKLKYPNNNFIKDKIKQQLQVLRDKGIIEFVGRGNYKKVKYGNI